MVSLTKYVIGIVLILLMALSLGSCDDSKSLQRYYVDKQEDDKFLKIDLATSLLQSENSNFSQEEKDILETVKKINIVAYPIKGGDAAEYEAEKEKVKYIIGQEKYKTLIKFSKNSTGATVKYLGEEEAIDEFIVFANDSEKGFALFRLSGDDMKPDAMLKLMSSINRGDIDASKLQSVGDLFSNM